MSNDITDPSDWPTEYASLREIDSHLRCPICKEMLRAAVMLQCHHNFCSECIRRHLDKESNCPACRIPTSTSQMRRNVALDEIANNFKDCRSKLLRILMESLEPKRNTSQQHGPLSRSNSMEIDDVALQQKRRRTSARMSPTNKSAPKISNDGSSNCSQDPNNMNMDLSLADDDNDDRDGDFVDVSSHESTSHHKGKHVTRSSGPVLRSRIPRSSNASTPLELSNNTAPAPELVSSTLPDFGPSNSASGAPTTSVPGSVLSKPSTLVACPICGNGIPFTYTNTHLDNYCLLKQNDPNYTIPYKVIITQKSDIIALYEKCGASGKSISNATANTSTSVSISSTTPGGSPRRTNDSQISPGLSFNSNGGKKPVATYPEPKRIPKLTYSILNDKQLRKKLQELGLPTHGDKQLMQKRHAEYVTIYNANCDATRPQTQAQLMKAMEVWERSYEKDMQTREAQRRALEQQQQIQQKELAQQKKKEEERAATENDTEPGTPTLSSSQSSSQNGGSNHVNNDAVAVAVATASAFAHALKYADEYAELIADVKKRMQADKEKKTLEDNQQAQMRTQPNS